MRPGALPYPRSHVPASPRPKLPCHNLRARGVNHYRTAKTSNQDNLIQEITIMNGWLRRSALLGAMMCIATVSAPAHDDKRGGSMTCNGGWQSNRLVNHCEIREQTLPATGGVISIDARKNGGISVKGWDRNEILVRSKVQAASPTQVEAESLAKQIIVQTAGGKIIA